MRNVVVVIAFVCFASLAMGQEAGMDRSARQRVEAGPEIWVNRDTGYPTREPIVAANPQDPAELIAGVIQTGPETDAVAVYISRDNGFTWHSSSIAGLPEEGSADPQIAFNRSGTAYFEALGLANGTDKRPHLATYLYRSTHDGEWQRLAILGADLDLDHPQMLVDGSGGRTTVYTTAVYWNDKGTNLALLSNDGSNSTTETLVTTDQQLFNLDPLLLSDGSLFIPFTRFAAAGPNQRPCPEQKLMFMIRQHGSKQVSAANQIRTIADPKSCGGGSPFTKTVFALGDAHFRDRIYVLSNEYRSGHYVLTLSHSDDHGRSWTSPRDVAPAVTGDQFRPAIAVGKNGVLGVVWCDTRESHGNEYREYFASSLDGGDSFLPAVAVSREPSPFQGSGNDVPVPSINSPSYNDKGEAQFSLEMASASTDAGEYTGLTVDSNGVFHPVWIDARNGSFQAWTAPVRVASGKDLKSQTVERAPVLGKDLAIVLDKTVYEPSTGIENIPVRLKNTSDRDICKPLSLIVVGSGNPQMPHNRIVNADNGRDWDGASFDYSRALGDYACLPPGGISSAIVWRVLTIVTPFSVQKPWASLRLKVSAGSTEGR